MIDIKQAYKYSWELTKSRPWYLVGFFALVSFVLGFVSGFFQGVSDYLSNTVADSTKANIALQTIAIVAILISIIVSLIVNSLQTFYPLSFSVNATRKQWPKYSDIIKKPLNKKTLLRLVAAYLVLSVAWFVVFVPVFLALFFGYMAIDPDVGIGILIISPIIVIMSSVITAIVLVPLFYPYFYLVIDKNQGPLSAIKESIKYTSGKRIQILKLLLISFIVSVVGVITIGGIFIAGIVNMLAFAYVYRQLIGENINAPDKAKSNKTIIIFYVLSVLIVILGIASLAYISFVSSIYSDPVLNEMIEKGKENSELLQQ